MYPHYTQIFPTTKDNIALKNKTSTSISLITVIPIPTFLTLILTLNNFIFNGIHYLQTKGCAMGTKCALTYAHIFMGEFEELHIYPRIKDKFIKYLRYIDNIFMIWTGTPTKLDQFTNEINKVYPSIKFTTQSSKTQVNFLDTTVRTNHIKLITKTFKKPTGQPAYLHSTSYHPNTLKNNIPYGQALRLKKICTNEKDYHESLQQMKQSFLKRGYKKPHLENQFFKAADKTRKQLLAKHLKARNDNIPFVTTFNKHLPNIRPAIEKHWGILKINPELEGKFQHKPFIAYRRNRNLKDFIVNNNKIRQSSTEEIQRKTKMLSLPHQTKQFRLSTN